MVITGFFHEKSLIYIPPEDKIKDKIPKLDWIGVNSKQDDQRFSSIIEFQDHFEF